MKHRTPDSELGALPPPTAICAGCDATAILGSDLGLPKGWTEKQGEPRCADCSPPKAAPEAAPRPRQVSIGDAASRYRGCRIAHEVSLGMAAIQIRAGGHPPEGRDEAINFIMDAHGIDELIIELSAIRAELRGGRSDG